MKTTTSERLYKLWTSGEELEAGQELYESIANEQRPSWAAAILSFSVEKSSVDLVQISDVLEIARDESRWGEAHKAFRAIRELTLKAETGRRASQLPEALMEATPSGNTEEYIAVLFVAEIAAKVIYNASGQPAPFDSDSGTWLAKNFRHFVTVCQAASEPAAWGLLCREAALSKA